MEPDRDPMFPLRLNDEDRALLEETSWQVRLSKSDTLRQALREFAKAKGVKVPKKGKR